jgi:Squalene-hopene cyclase C-terminal domain
LSTQSDKTYFLHAQRALPPSLPRSLSGNSDGDNSSEAGLESLVNLEAIQEEAVAYVKKGMPAWLVSFITHILFFIILVLIPFQASLAPGLNVFMSTGDTNAETSSFELPSADSEKEFVSDLEASELSVDVQPIEIGEMEMPTSVLSSEVKLPAIQMTLTGRTGRMKSTLLAAYGGTLLTEEAVALGLAWLAEKQKSDGGWSLVGPYSNGSTNESRCAATAMAMLAFIGAGNTHRDGNYQKVVERGLNFLTKAQDKEGFMAKEPSGQHGQMYAQAQASMVLCELYAMTGDEKLKPKAQLAIKFAEDSQSDLGGWRYQPRIDADTSVTGWFVMALMSGRMGGLSTNAEKLGNVSRFLDSVQSEGGALYAYTDREVDYPRPSMVAEGLLCRIFLGWPRYDERLKLGVEALLSQPISSDIKKRNFYYWYYATQTLHHYGGKPWEQWNDVMRRELPGMQIKDGPEAGSWPSDGDPHGIGGGRLYSTCLSIYCLEVYYRHLPIYDLKMLTGSEADLKLE